jgi:DNA-binding PadR family transcriptional regulator
MFHRHFMDFDRERGAHGGFGRERGFGRHWRGGGFEPREGRMFDSGDLKLVILALVAEKPHHGYEIIKALEERVGGGYSPSPGVVYPTLTLIEEMGYATAQDQGGRKLYTVTPEGEAFLAANRAQVDAIFARLDGANETRRGDFAPLLRAMENLRMAVRLRVRRRDATPTQIQAIADALDAAAKAIERL